MKRILSIILSVIILCSLASFGAAAQDVASVTLSGITDGQTIAYGTELKVTAESSVEAASLTLWLDGEEYATAENTLSSEFVLENISAGRHTLKATADTAESEKIEFYYISVVEEQLSKEIFDDTTLDDWDKYSSSKFSFAQLDENDTTYGNSLLVNNNIKKAEDEPKETFRTKSGLTEKISSGDIVFEYDTAVQVASGGSKSVNAKAYIVNGSNASYIGGVAWVNYKAQLDGSIKDIAMTNDVWYHVKFEFNMATRKVNFYAGEVGNTLEKIGEYALDATKFTAITDFRYEFTGYGDSKVYTDNLVFKKVKHSAYLKEPSYFIGDTEYAAADIPANPNKMLIPFSTDMDDTTITKDNITVKSGEETVGIAAVEYVKDKKAALVTFSESLSSNKAFSVSISKDVKTSQDVTQPTDLGFKFKTGYNDFDMISCVAKKSGTVIDAADIASGDEITFEYTLQNKTDTEQTGALIFAVYENDALAYLNIQDISVSTEEVDDRKTISSTASYTASASPESIEVYLWKSMTERTSQLKAYKMK